MPPTPEENQIAVLAVTPSATDIAIASDVILAHTGDAYVSTNSLLAVVASRLVDEPIPDFWSRLQFVEESEVRRVRSAATGITAIAELEALGAILPIGRPDYYYGTWALTSTNPRAPGGYSAEAGAFNYGIASGYRGASYRSESRLIDSPRVFLSHVPTSMGPKVRRVLEEAVNAYRFRQYVSVAILLGVASEAAWRQLAEALRDGRSNTSLQKLLANPRAGAAEIQERVLQGLRSTDVAEGIDLDAIALTAQTYRELRNYAVHRAEEQFDETRVARPRVGVLLEASVEYFTRLYELEQRLR